MDNFQITLLENGVHYLIFTFDWYNDIDQCLILELYDEQTTIVAKRYQHTGEIRQTRENVSTVVDSDHVQSWEYGLANHLYHLEDELKVPEDIRGSVMFLDVKNNKIAIAGTRLTDGTEGLGFPFFAYCADIQAFLTAWTTEDSTLLSSLARHPDEFVRLRVAKNQKISSNTLEQLVGDLSFMVSATAIARAGDTDFWWRHGSDLQEVKENCFSLSRLESWVSFGNPQVLLACLEQPKIYTSLFKLAQHFDWQLVFAVYLHPEATETIQQTALEQLLSASRMVHLRLARHQKSPRELLEELEKVVQDDVILTCIQLHPNYGKLQKFVD